MADDEIAGLFSDPVHQLVAESAYRCSPPAELTADEVRTKYLEAEQNVANLKMQLREAQTDVNYWGGRLSQMRTAENRARWEHVAASDIGSTASSVCSSMAGASPCTAGSRASSAAGLVAGAPSCPDLREAVHAERAQRRRKLPRDGQCLACWCLAQPRRDGKKPNPGGHAHTCERACSARKRGQKVVATESPLSSGERGEGCNEDSTYL